MTTRRPGRYSRMTYGPAAGNERTPSGSGGSAGGTAQKNGIVVQAAKSRTSRVKRMREGVARCVDARGAGCLFTAPHVVGADDCACVEEGGGVDAWGEGAVDRLREGVWREPGCRR